MATADSQLRPTGEGIIPLTVTGAALTDRGPTRQRNEDSVCFRAPGDVGTLLRKGVLALVADGMGGHVGGEVASGLAAGLVESTYFASAEGPQAALEEAFRVANEEILGQGRARRELMGMGTTCTAVAVVNGFAFCAHVGDSRAYLVRGGETYCLTEDHSTTMEMVKQGMLTRAQARVHEERNVILRALGTRAKVDVAVWPTPFPMKPGDRILLCSDGLYEVIEESEMASLTAGGEPAELCQRLIALAIERRSSDNVSAALLQLGGV